MRALKARILAKACQRNFEAHNLTGAFRSKALDHSTVEHTNKALKQWYRSIKNLVTDYNKCSTHHPSSIEMKGLFSLDVDNDIWQDIGLADDEFGGQSSLQHWFNDESAALIAVLQASKGTCSVAYRFGQEVGCSIDALAPNVAQSEVGQSELGQSEVGQSKVTQSKVTQSEVAQSEVTQSEVAQYEVAQSKVAQSKVGQSEVAQSKLAGSLAEQAAIPKLPRSDKWTVGPGEGEWIAKMMMKNLSWSLGQLLLTSPTHSYRPPS
ncbi:hypothetical protein BS47DRAFT_1368266 [Hydnum rufescens UP504]|uniref:Uncharacterized protein n=1 Tax=Hydnum rufescens UP504 TaxID=1448309 RepID=A0A9P6AG02_9AGAM|nr:hypothetical protein BS47DRAFT_1368266 [Hydnum rufescens UP504]